MERLCELGIDTTQATMCWIKRHDDDGTSKDILCMHDEFCYEFSSLDPEPAFTLQDIIDLLPKELDIDVFCHKWFLMIDYQGLDISYSYMAESGALYSIKRISVKEISLIDAAYEMLCWCIENEYVRTESN